MGVGMSQSCFWEWMGVAGLNAEDGSPINIHIQDFVPGPCLACLDLQMLALCQEDVCVGGYPSRESDWVCFMCVSCLWAEPVLYPLGWVGCKWLVRA